MIAVLYTLAVTHITIVCVTLFLHRSQAHRGITFNPAITHFMRFWLWLTTGMVTKQWVAVHRKHHQCCDLEGDPHSPRVFGILRVLFTGAELYARSAKDTEMVNTYGVGTPDDWIEQHVYTPYNYTGIIVMLIVDVIVFNWVGAIIWLVQMAWIPFWAAGVINGIGHYWGYRNGTTKDDSKNIAPWGIIIGGEELHNNHHLDPANPKLSHKPWEFDIGWMYFKLLQQAGLAQARA
jgi:stearoyl-CoA desaturase (delta-9 desaturase)